MTVSRQPAANLRVVPPETSPPPATVGRHDELARIAAAVGALASGRGTTLVIEGPGGIGKSHLVGESVRAAHEVGWKVFSASGSELERQRPFGPLLDALGCRTDHPDPARSAIGRMVRGSGVAEPLSEGATTRFAVQDAIVDLVESWLVREPLVIAVDDLHWADAATVAAIGALARLSPALPLLLVVATRPLPRSADLDALVRELNGPGQHLLSIAPLSADEARRLADTWGAADVGSAATVERAGGNPFLLRYCLSSDGEDAGAVRALLGGLASGTLRALRVAAVYGRTFRPADLTPHLEGAPSEQFDALAAAVRAGILVEQGPRLAFVHDLVREEIAQDIPIPLRLALHRAMWEVGSAAGVDPLVTLHHLLAVAEAGDADAVRSLRAAATRQVDTNPGEAADLFERAAALAKPLGWALRGEIAVEQMTALRLANRPADAHALAEEVSGWPIGAEALARVEHDAALALRFLGRLPDSIAWMRRALARRALGPELDSWGWSFIVGSLVWSLAPDETVRDAIEQARAEAAAAGDLAAAVQAICADSSAQWMAGRVAEAQRLAEEATRMAVPLGNAVWPAPALFKALALITAGDPMGAVASIAPWGRLAERRGDLWALSRMEMVTALGLFDAGDFGAVEAHADTIMRIGDQTGGANGQPMAQALSGLVAVRRGDLDLAREFADAGHVVAGSPCVDPAGLPFLGWLDAEIAYAEGDLAGGRAVLDATYDLVVAAAPIAQLWLAPLVASWAAADGDAARVESVAVLVRSAADLARTARADAVADECARLAESMARPGSKSRPEPVRARRTTTEPVGSGLTPAELAVLELVAEGLPNLAIADRLFLSKRTVESHVSRMYVKLGVGTRVELAHRWMAST